MKSALILWSLILAVSLDCGGSTLYVTDDRSSNASGQKLYTLSAFTAVPTFVGSPLVGNGILADLAYDSTQNVLYSTTTQNDNLYSINPITGAATLIGPLGVSLMHALAFDSISGSLYGASVADSKLYNINSATGKATAIGPIGLFYPDPDNTISGMAFDPATHVLYGCISGPAYVGGLMTISTTTGAGAFLGTMQPLSDIAFHPETGLLFGIDNGIGDHPDGLYQINLSNRNATPVGLTGLENSLGLEFIPEPSALTLLAGGLLTILCRRWRVFKTLRE